jgi:ferredoxin
MQHTTITGLDVSKGRFHIIVEPSLCMAFGSCETLAPSLVIEKNKRINPKARIESEIGANIQSDTLVNKFFPRYGLHYPSV